MRRSQRHLVGRADVVMWLVSLSWVATIAWFVVGSGGAIRDDVTRLSAWAVVLAVVNFLPVTGWERVHFAPDFPILVAAALILSPVQLAVVAFVGAFDPQEFKGAWNFQKILFNRAQASLGATAGAVAAHWLTTSPGDSPYVVLLAFVVLSIQATTNYVLVSTVVALAHKYRLHDVVARMRVGSVVDFGLAFLGCGVLGAMLATLYVESHYWALIAFLAPALLVRQVLLKSQLFLETEQAYRSREEAVARLENAIHHERSDERRLIAADLHDEVLQPLFKVTLMAQVLKADLAGGRLLDLDEDLPQLLDAAEVASGSLRELIGDLRRSSLGRGGLSPALSNLARRLADDPRVKLSVDLEAVETEPKNQLVLYQVAKEALTNALTHSKATTISLVLRGSADGITLIVRDDGTGFDPFIEREGHYGMHIMRERVAAAGGDISFDTAPGEGTTVLVHVPP